MDEDNKQAIAEARRRQIARDAERTGPPLTEGRKRCTKCREMKRWDTENRWRSEFPIRTRKNKVTGTVHYPAGECKVCNAARSAAHRAKLRREGKLAAAQRRWNASRDPEARRRYQREYGRMLRAKNGVTPRGPWLKYREEMERTAPRVAIQPFLEWFDEWLLATGKVEERVCAEVDDLLEHTKGVANRTLRRWREDRTNGRLDVIDAFTVVMGMPDQLTVLYPLDQAAAA